MLTIDNNNYHQKTSVVSLKNVLSHQRQTEANGIKEEDM